MAPRFSSSNFLEQLNIVDILYPSNKYNFGFTSSKAWPERNAKFGLSLVGTNWTSPYIRVQGEEKEDWVKALITLKDYCTSWALKFPTMMQNLKRWLLSGLSGERLDGEL
ncbi:hypothetical protein BT69DRAFT_1332396 [Atractiella rhizophila]|nr:hypothetical protein BT69DRAFT_1332396 [Atractiella rhizophila]